MIEKLDKDCGKLQKKINELVDAVNGILAAQEQYATIYKEDIVPMLTPKNEEPVDPYAEQRKWIGKLCMFWDKEIGEKVWGILGGIDYSENEKYPYWCDQLQEQYQCCEPVKPDDDIIYKGGDNE